MKSDMNPKRYRALIKEIGSHLVAGDLLGVQRECISKRCNSHQTITKEAALAATHLAEKARAAGSKKASDLF